jgi:hypothetical protein
VRILVACEESQAVTIEMRRLGHEAYSCDIQDCSGGHPEWHIKGDALELINGRCRFQTMDGEWHELVGKWDLLIAHPPCTFLSAAGSQRTFPVAGVPDPERFRKGQEAAVFFLAFWNADCPRIVIENPVPMKCFGLPPYSQIVHPYMFGDPWFKRTCLWIKGGATLVPTKVVQPEGYWVQRSGKRAKGSFGGHRDPKLRSKTFPGIARAMAEQWAGDAREEEKHEEA